MAELLAAIHGRGLVYVDPSPHNVFVSEPADADEVRLIDVDNLRPATTPGRTVYTPGYGAPEIVQARWFPARRREPSAKRWSLPSRARSTKAECPRNYLADGLG